MSIQHATEYIMKYALSNSTKVGFERDQFEIDLTSDTYIIELTRAFNVSKYQYGYRLFILNEDEYPIGIVSGVFMSAEAVTKTIELLIDELGVHISLIRAHDLFIKAIVDLYNLIGPSFRGIRVMYKQSELENILSPEYITISFSGEDERVININS